MHGCQGCPRWRHAVFTVGDHADLRFRRKRWCWWHGLRQSKRPTAAHHFFGGLGLEKFSSDKSCHILFKHRSDSKASKILTNYDEVGHWLFRLLWLWRFLCLFLDLPRVGMNSVAILWKRVCPTASSNKILRLASSWKAHLRHVYMYIAFCTRAFVCQKIGIFKLQ